VRWVEAPDGALDRRRAALVFVGVYLLFIATYLPINLFSVGRDAAQLWLPGEQNIPFVPEAEFIYVLGYLFPVLAVFRMPDVETFRRLLVAVGITLAVAYVTYLAFPVFLPRPTIEVDSLAKWLVSLEYNDPSYNHFPSLHVAFTWLIYLACRKAVRQPRALLVAAIAISVSTVFVKQHYIADIIYGLALAEVAWRLASRGSVETGVP